MNVTHEKLNQQIFNWQFFQNHAQHTCGIEFFSFSINCESQKKLLLYFQFQRKKIWVTRVFSGHCTFDVQEKNIHTHIEKQRYQIKMRHLIEIIILHTAFHCVNRCRAHQKSWLLKTFVSPCVRFSIVQFPTKKRVIIHSFWFFSFIILSWCCVLQFAILFLSLICLW